MELLQVYKEGLCLFGCHDGWVYALRIPDGSLAWRFLAAPYERKIVAYSQLESSWPVYGVVIHQGHICASAGLHPEAGGGIYVYGLEPKTGRLLWKRFLSKSPAVIHGTSPPDARRSCLWQLTQNNKESGGGGSILLCCLCLYDSCNGLSYPPRRIQRRYRTRSELSVLFAAREKSPPAADRSCSDRHLGLFCGRAPCIHSGHTFSEAVLRCKRSDGPS